MDAPAVAEYLEDRIRIFRGLRGCDRGDLRSSSASAATRFPIAERQIVTLREKIHELEAEVAASSIRYGTENDQISEKVHRSTPRALRLAPTSETTLAGAATTA